MLRVLRAFAWMRWRVFMNSLEKTGARDMLERFSLAIEHIAPIVLALVMILGAGARGAGGLCGLSARERRPRRRCRSCATSARQDRGGHRGAGDRAGRGPTNPVRFLLSRRCAL
jgi:hypothetical protein